MNRFLIVIVGIASILFLFAEEIESNFQLPGSKPKVIYSQPTGRLGELVSPISELAYGNPDADNIAAVIYNSRKMADTATSKQTLAEMNKRLSELLQEAGGTRGSDLIREIDHVFKDYVGTSGELTEQDRQRWRDVCEAVAWAISSSKRSFLASHQPSYDDDEPPSYMVGEPSPIPTFAGLIHQPITDPALVENSNLLFGMQEPDLPKHMTNSLRFDEDALEQFLATTPKFRDLSPTRYGSGRGRTRLNFRAARFFDKSLFDDEAQVVGDCVSHSTRNASDIARATEILVDGDPEEWVNRGATELIYGMRKYGGDGMLVSTAAEIITETGGVIIRKDYGDVDLSSYDGRIGDRWGKSDGPPRRLVEISRRHQMQKAALITSMDDAVDALWEKYPLVIGARASFAQRRDQYGFSPRTGTNWAHAQCVGGVSTAKTLAGDDWRKYGSRPDSPCFLIINSWGPDWIKGPKGRFTDIPDGSYWVSEADFKFVLDQRQVIAIGDFDGFEPPPVSSFNFEYLNNPSPMKRYVDPAFYGLAEIVMASSPAATEGGADITLPKDVEVVEAGRDPDYLPPAPEPKPEPRPLPKVDPDLPKPVPAVSGKRWVSLDDALTSTSKLPVIVVVSEPWCSYCKVQKANIDKLHETNDFISCEINTETLKRKFNQRAAKLPASIIWRPGTEVGNLNQAKVLLGAYSVDIIKRELLE